MRLVVSIPTTGRRRIVGPTIRDIAGQTRLPDLLVVVCARDGDIDLSDLEGLPFPMQVVQSEIGLTRQRNRTLEMLDAEDILLFLDDDFVMARDYLACLERLFEGHRDVVLATGRVLADGIHGPGLAHDEAAKYLGAVASGACSGHLATVYNGYGCNMAIRARPVVEHNLRFDPNLPFYGWLEDVDFSRQLSAYGRIVRANTLRGVHLGTKTGRSGGLRLGYSQIANPLYLRSKRTMRGTRAFAIMLRNVVSNLVRSLYPEPEIDRRGRLRGNLRAMRDIATGELRPERVKDFE
ncbi:glycosyltransferase family 2 protein [Actibacterium sp. MT2.3-13A]|uniref:glycosyltransferase family 2 protein n=1 Tax=Actibacterium sp. MT2.3-13A TaxID=2828332 RepID=UPI001BAA8A93|nr:glycosyltransferase family 2 protein [Actibacterium sp. MT2.3-13A]